MSNYATETDLKNAASVDTSKFARKVNLANLKLKLKQENLASKSDIANFVRNTEFDNKRKDITLNTNELNRLWKKV